MSLRQDIVELLTKVGPLTREDIRTRLCVASESRLDAAMFVLKQECRIETVYVGRGQGYRVPGDTRALMAGDIHLQNKWKRKARRAACA